MTTIVHRQLHIHLRNLTQECSETFISQLSLFTPVKMPNFATNCHFVSLWKSTDWKKWLAFGLCVDCYRIMQEIQQKDSLKHLFQNYSQSSPAKSADFTTHRHFVSSWKSIYRKRCSVFWWLDQDCALIAAELCVEFNTRILLNIYFRFSPHPLPLKIADFNTTLFCFLIKKIMREVTIIYIATVGLFSFKVPFFFVVSAFFDKYAMPFLKRNVYTMSCLQ